MKHWNTSKIKALLKDKVSEFIDQIEVLPPGGDVDTERLRFTAKGCEDAEAALLVYGFRTDGEPITDPASVDIEFIILTDGQFMNTALGTDDEATCVLYGRCYSILKKAGFSITHSMDGFF